MEDDGELHPGLYRGSRAGSNAPLGLERQFEIVGEALAGLLRVAPEPSARVTDARRIDAFRNRLIHGYPSVADEVVWGVIEVHLATLKRGVSVLAEEP